MQTEDDLIREHTLRTLAECLYNKTETAQRLNISRATLLRRLNRYDRESTGRFKMTRQNAGARG